MNNSSSGGAAIIFSGGGGSGGASGHRVGVGFGLAISVGILVLASTILLATYVCIKLHSRSFRHNSLPHPPPAAPISAARGLDEATLQSYPKISFDPASPPPLLIPSSSASASAASEPPSCPICLSDYLPHDSLRLLPDCRHSYHSSCIDSWLRLHASCPLCRSSPLTTPSSTPLSDLIPLARHHQITVSYTVF